MNKSIKIATQLVKCDIEMKEKKKACSLQEHISEEFKGIEIDRLDPNLIRYILEKIENESSPKHDKDHTKNTFFDIYMSLFNIKQMTPDEKKNITKIIDFLHKEKLVRKVKLSSVILFYLKNRLI